MWPTRNSCRLWCVAAVVATVSGCANWTTPRIDPTGEHIFASQPVAPVATAPTAYSTTGTDTAVTLTPTDQIAPVGSEVILVAGVIGTDGYLKPQRRLEWSIAPGTVGHFTSIDKSDCFDRLLGDHNPHEIRGGTYAVGSTLPYYESIERGTPNPADVVNVTSGQGWVKITSPIEGVSVVTVVAPEVYRPEMRQKTATIHWVGTNRPLPGGPIPQIGPIPSGTGTQATTSGPASPTGSPGIGPSGAAGAGQPASTSLIDLQITEPPQATVGSKVTFKIIVTNRSSKPTEPLKLYVEIGPGLQFDKPTPKNRLNAPIGILDPREPAKDIPIEFTVTQPGQLCHIVKVLGAGDKVLASKRACVMVVAASATPAPGGTSAATPPGEKYGESPATGAQSGAQTPGKQNPPPSAQPALSVRVTGQPKRTTQELTTFSIDVKNIGTKSLNNVKVEATLDPAFDVENASASQGFLLDKKVLYYVQKELPPGYTLKLEIQCQCLKAAPQATAYVTASSPDSAPAEAKATTEIVDATPPPGTGPGTMPDKIPGTTPDKTPDTTPDKIPGSTPANPPKAVESKLSLALRGFANPVRVGKQFVYLITVTNNGVEDEQDVIVEALMPDDMTVDLAASKGPTPIHLNPNDQQNVQFDKLPVLGPGKSADFLVSVQAKKAGNMTFKAGVSSQKLTQAIIKEETTEVTPKS